MSSADPAPAATGCTCCCCLLLELLSELLTLRTAAAALNAARSLSVRASLSAPAAMTVTLPHKVLRIQ